MSDERDSTTVDDIYVPTDTEVNPLLWDGNYAKIPGLMNETNKHCVRKGILGASTALHQARRRARL